MIQRIKEYKTDFAYYSESCFNAFKRLKVKEKKKRARIKRMNICSLVLSILTISVFMTQILDLFTKEWSVLIASVSGLISIILNILSLLSVSEEKSSDYLIRAEKANILCKKARDIQNLASAGCLSKEQIVKELLYLQAESEKNALSPLPIMSEDYEKAKQQILQGVKSYTTDDLNL